MMKRIRQLKDRVTNPRKTTAPEENPHQSRPSKETRHGNNEHRHSNGDYRAVNNKGANQSSATKTAPPKPKRTPRNERSAQNNAQTTKMCNGGDAQDGTVKREDKINGKTNGEISKKEMDTVRTTTHKTNDIDKTENVNQGPQKDTDATKTTEPTKPPENGKIVVPTFSYKQALMRGMQPKPVQPVQPTPVNPQQMKTSRPTSPESNPPSRPQSGRSNQKQATNLTIKHAPSIGQRNRNNKQKTNGERSPPVKPECMAQPDLQNKQNLTLYRVDDKQPKPDYSQSKPVSEDQLVKQNSSSVQSRPQRPKTETNMTPSKTEPKPSQQPSSHNKSNTQTPGGHDPVVSKINSVDTKSSVGEERPIMSISSIKDLLSKINSEISEVKERNQVEVEQTMMEAISGELKIPSKGVDKQAAGLTKSEMKPNKTESTLSETKPSNTKSTISETKQSKNKANHEQKPAVHQEKKASPTGKSTVEAPKKQEAKSNKSTRNENAVKQDIPSVKTKTTAINKDINKTNPNKDAPKKETKPRVNAIANRAVTFADISDMKVYLIRKEDTEDETEKRKPFMNLNRRKPPSDSDPKYQLLAPITKPRIRPYEDPQEEETNDIFKTRSDDTSHSPQNETTTKCETKDKGETKDKQTAENRDDIKTESDVEDELFPDFKGLSDKPNDYFFTYTEEESESDEEDEEADETTNVKEHETKEVEGKVIATKDAPSNRLANADKSRMDNSESSQVNKGAKSSSNDLQTDTTLNSTLTSPNDEELQNFQAKMVLLREQMSKLRETKTLSKVVDLNGISKIPNSKYNGSSNDGKQNDITVGVVLNESKNNDKKEQSGVDNSNPRSQPVKPACAATKISIDSNPKQSALKPDHDVKNSIDQKNYNPKPASELGTKQKQRPSVTNDENPIKPYSVAKQNNAPNEQTVKPKLDTSTKDHKMESSKRKMGPSDNKEQPNKDKTGSDKNGTDSDKIQTDSDKIDALTNKIEALTNKPKTESDKTLTSDSESESDDEFEMPDKRNVPWRSVNLDQVEKKLNTVYYLQDQMEHMQRQMGTLQESMVVAHKLLLDVLENTLDDLATGLKS